MENNLKRKCFKDLSLRFQTLVFNILWGLAIIIIFALENAIAGTEIVNQASVLGSLDNHSRSRDSGTSKVQITDNTSVATGIKPIPQEVKVVASETNAKVEVVDIKGSTEVEVGDGPVGISASVDQDNPAINSDNPLPESLNAENPSALQPSGTRSVISSFQAFVLGLVEGITEFLPVSSTGHLVIASELLGVRNSHLTSEEEDAVAAFEIIIQSGAILAVVFLYWKKIQIILLGILGRSPEGRSLFLNILAAFFPTAVLGLFLNKIIKTYLQHSGPVILALAVGGLVMILFEKSRLAMRVRTSGLSLAQLSLRTAFFIGLFQSLAMWPGTSRSMMTILGGMLLGLSPVASAEFSFLLGLPTLLAATGLKAVQDGELLFRYVDWSAMLIGLVFAALSAFIAVKAFVSWLNKHGLAPFGWYRILVAAILIYLFHYR